MKVFEATLEVKTAGPGFVDVTKRIRELVVRSDVVTGVCSVFIQHTSASLVVQENADPAVLRDLLAFIERFAPEGDGYEHDAEGPDDMPSHIKSAVTKTSETLPVRGGDLALGTWQALYVWEHRRAPHTRRLLVTVVGA